MRQQQRMSNKNVGNKNEKKECVGEWVSNKSLEEHEQLAILLTPSTSLSTVTVTVTIQLMNYEKSCIEHVSQEKLRWSIT